MDQRKSLAGARILVTGGAGFVGSNLVRKLLDSDAAAVVVIDNLLSAERTNLADDARVELIEGSCADDAVLGPLEDAYDYVFHLSTYHGNQSSIHDPLADHANNLLTTLKLCERLKGFTRLKKLVYAGAGCAVAEKTDGQAEATAEDAPISLEMDSPYSISKLVGEFYAIYYHRRHGLPSVRARFQNVYGPGEILGAGRWRGTPATVWRNVTPTFIWKALKGEALPLERGGTATRDFIYVDDICRGLMLCALAGPPGDVFNLASGVETSIRTLAESINRLTGSTRPVDLKPGRDWDRSGHRFGSTSRARQALGFTAEVAIEEGLTRTIEWTRKQSDLIARAMARHRDSMAAAGAPLS